MASIRSFHQSNSSPPSFTEQPITPNDRSFQQLISAASSPEVLEPTPDQKQSTAQQESQLLSILLGEMKQNGDGPNNDQSPKVKLSISSLSGMKNEPDSNMVEQFVLPIDSARRLVQRLIDENNDYFSGVVDSTEYERLDTHQTACFGEGHTESREAKKFRSVMKEEGIESATLNAGESSLNYSMSGGVSQFEAKN